MTAIPGDSSFDPDEQAENVANSAYKRLLYRRIAAVALAALGFNAYMLFDYAFGILALWHVPQWLIGFLASFMIATLAYMVIPAARARREGARKRAAATKGDRMMAVFDQMQQWRSHPARAPWREGIKNPRFWGWLLIRAVYTACAALVLTEWLGLTAGAVIAAGYVVVAMAIREGTNHAVTRFAGTVAFIDPRPPRDTPEM
jgi:hypothetical protein